MWEHVKDHIALTPEGYVIFDDTVLDKRHARKIALVRRQYSGNAQGVINGIGVVTCVYVNPQEDRFWLIDYRIYDPQGDGKTKLDPLKDMLSGLVYQKRLPFTGVLMDSWYATKNGHATHRADAKNLLLSPQDEPARGRVGRHNPLPARR